MSKIEESKMVYFMANCHKKGWCKEPVELSFFEDKIDTKILPSRIYDKKDKTLWIRNKPMAHLFAKQSDQIKYLQEKGWI